MTNLQLLSKEIDYLVQHYRITTEQQENPLSFPCAELLNKEFVADLINRLKGKYQVNDPFVITSQFMKRYAFMVTVPYFYTLSIWEKRLEISPEKVSFQSFEENGVWVPKLCLSSLETTTPEDVSRDLWRREAYEELFKDHLSPVIKVFADQGKVSHHILWENTATYIFWIYERMMEQFPENCQIQEDFHYLLEADANLFGDYTYNPISKFHIEKRYVPQQDATIRVRQTCCFYNRLPGVADSCTSCPLTCKIVQKRGDEVYGRKATSSV
jgi:ferric iron reductase protein FhuF